ncbi:hypothetical protein J2Z50_000778 [Ensifer mexicanus]|nr:hypothetical protein [Sinorhizobium mexicanum]
MPIQLPSSNFRIPPNADLSILTCDVRFGPTAGDLFTAQCHNRANNDLTRQVALGAETMAKHRIYTTSFASVYPHYIAKAEKKGRTKAEVDQVISWLTGYGPKEFEAQLARKTDFETFFADAPKMNPSRALIKGVVCGVRVEDIEEPTMREIRYLDKLIDELARGKAMDKILREN